MKLDINELPDLEMPVGSFGSARAESAKVIPAIIGGVIVSVIVSDEMEER